MSRGRSSRLLALLGLAALAWAAQGSTVQAQGCATCAQGCASGFCQTLHCPPWFHHCQERPPVICIRCGCPRPVCNPCALPNFGYFQTCWSPWPLPPDWSHCKVPPPAAFVQLNPPHVAGPPGTMPVTPPAPTTTPSPLPNGSAAPIMPPSDNNETLPRPAPFTPGTGAGRVIN